MPRATRKEPPRSVRDRGSGRLPLAASCVFVLMFLLLGGCRAPKPAPDVVLITLDTTRADHLGAYGYDHPVSPVIDRVSREAVLFTRAWSTAPWTLPSHASMFTGKHPVSHGADFDMRGGDATLDQALSAVPAAQSFRVNKLGEEQVTLAELLRQKGYTTAAFAGGPWLSPVFGLLQGYDVQDADVTEYGGRSAEELTDRAIAWLGGLPPDRPMHLLVNYFDPHAPYDPAPGFLDLVRDTTANGDSVSDGTTSHPPDRSILTRRETTALYDGEIRFMDHHLGRLFEALRTSGRYETSLIVIVADHGEMLGEHGQVLHGPFLYEPLLRVPLLVRYPAARGAGSVVDATVSVMDLLPLIAAEVGISLPNGVEGLPVGERRFALGQRLRDDASIAKDPSLDRDLTALIRWPWKLVVSDKGPTDLFRLDTDPEELQSLQSPRMQRALQRELGIAMAGLSPPKHPSRPSGVDEATLARLHALGYIEAPSTPSEASNGPELEAFTPLERLGTRGSYAEIGKVVRPVLSARPDQGAVAIALSNFPARKVRFFAAYKGEPAKGDAGPARCTVSLERENGQAVSLGTFEVDVRESRWNGLEARIEDVQKGRLLLGCGGNGVEPGAFVWARPQATRLEPVSSQPLVVLICLGGLRADHVAGFGGPADWTPALDRLGKEGLRFLNATSEATWTMASSYALLRSRLYGFIPTEAPAVPLAESLANAGFLTVGLTGGGPLSHWYGFNLGFDHFGSGYGGDDPEAELSRLLADASGWIDANPQVPLFLFLHSDAIERRLTMERKKSPVGEVEAERMANERRLYLSSVRHADDALAPLLERLREVGRQRRVLVALTSDHGVALGRPATLHDEVIRIPLMVWGPGWTRSAAIKRPTMLSDVAPSILGAVGVPKPASMLGSDVSPSWFGESDVAAKAESGTVSQAGESWSLREERRKLIVRTDETGAVVDRNLYDLSDGSNEQHDIAADEEQTVDRMIEELGRRIIQLGGAENDAALPVCPYCKPAQVGDFVAASRAARKAGDS